MKKKILSFVLVICLIFPCLFIFSACWDHQHEFNGEWIVNPTHHWHYCNNCKEKEDYDEHNWDDGEIISLGSSVTEGVMLLTCEDCGYSKLSTFPYATVTLVSDDQWIEACDFSSTENYTVTRKINSVENAKSVKEGNEIYYIDIEDGTEYYVCVEDDKYYQYMKDGDNWTRSQCQEAAYLELNLFTILSDVQNLKSMFEYNEETKAYEATNIYLGSGEFVVLYEKVQVFFAGGKVVKYWVKSGDMEGEIIVEYKNEQVTLPQVA